MLWRPLDPSGVRWWSLAREESVRCGPRMLGGSAAVGARDAAFHAALASRRAEQAAEVARVLALHQSGFTDKRALRPLSWSAEHGVPSC